MFQFLSQIFGDSGTHARPRRSSALRVESLADRVVPSISFSNGDLYITGTPGSDYAAVSFETENGGQYKIIDAGITYTVPQTTIHGGDVYFYAGMGNDFFANSTSLRSVAYGEDGTDNLFGGASAARTT